MIRTPRPVVAAALAVAVVTGLVGCVGSTPVKSPTPSSKPTPLYSSDAEALAAARQSWKDYVDSSTQVGNNGWSDLSALRSVETGDALKADTTAGQANHDKGLHLQGDIAGDVYKIEEITPTSVNAYTCADFSGTRIIDSAGADRTSPTRSNVLPYQARFVIEKGRLLVGRVDLWSGTSFCS